MINNNTLKVFISGEGGQGVQILGKIIASAAFNNKIHSSYMPHYGFEMRMGISRAFIILSDNEISYPKFELADIVVAMTIRNLEIVKGYIDRDTDVINAIDLVNFPAKNNLPANSFNMIILGILANKISQSIFKITKEKILQEINKFLAKKPHLKENLQAFAMGYDLDKKYYSLPFDKISKPKFLPIINKDSEKEHIKYPDMCKGCGLCLEKCPVKALSWDKDNLNFISKPIPKVDMKKCIACKICEQICPDCAIKINKI